MAKRQPPAGNASERQKIIAAVMEWQEPATWKIAFNLGAKFHKYKASAAENRELARKYPDDAIWAKAAERAERAAEIYHQQIVEKHGELLKVKNYLRLNEPDLFPLVPIVDFFGEPPADVLSLAKNMELVESALRVRMVRPGDAAQSRAVEAAVGNAKPRKAKRSTEQTDAEAKLIAALTKHHQYADGGCLNLDAIGCRALAQQAKVGLASASRFFDKHFKGHKKYRNHVCADKAKLITALKMLNQEFSPCDLYGAKPPGEGERDD